MARNFNELLDKMGSERRARVEKRVRETIAEMPLAKIRQARGMTQVQLAEQIGSSQSEVSQMEHRANLYVSTLRRFIEALGGSLEIVARFPEGSTRVSFEGLDDEPEETPRKRAHG